MARIILLSLAGAIVFAEITALFLLPGPAGIFTGSAMIALGSVALVTVAWKTRKFLDEDTAWNRVMKADGESLIERNEQQ